MFKGKGFFGFVIFVFLLQFSVSAYLKASNGEELSKEELDTYCVHATYKIPDGGIMIPGKANSTDGVPMDGGDWLASHSPFCNWATCAGYRRKYPERPSSSDYRSIKTHSSLFGRSLYRRCRRLYF